MIDQLATLGKVNSIGKDGFVWWIGQVAPPQSWRDVNANIRNSGAKPARVKVRIVGYHPFDPEGNILPDDDLPWAEVLADPYSGSGQGGLSESLTLVGGERVLGFFLDGEDAQQPVVMGLFPKYDNVKNTYKASEIASRKSSGFQSFEAYTRPNSTQPAAPNNLQTNVNEDKNESGEKNKTSIATGEKGTRQIAKSGSVAESTLEEKANTTAEGFTPCENNSIGRISQLVQDFIKGAQGLEQAGDAWIDPITNTVVDMQAELAFIKNEVASVTRATMNEMKIGLMKKVNKKFKNLVGDIKKNDPTGLFKEKAAKKSGGSITDLINCAFNKALDMIGDFIKNMFKNLLGNILNAAICAIEQFVGGIFSKMFSVLEGLLGTIMSGLNWLVGGFDSIKNIFRSASNLASKILAFLEGCNIEPCGKPSKFASDIGTTLAPPDNFGSMMDKVNVLSGLSQSLIDAGRGGGIREGIGGLFGNDPGDDAMGGLTIFGEGDFLFEDCNRINDNPPSQIDIIPRRPGFIYPKCIPPDYVVLGSGSGAELLIIVGNSNRIFSVEVINGGSGYDTDTQITIIDNTGNGSGANVKPIVKDGSIVSVVILSAGFGYCLGGSDVGISTNIVGEIIDVFVSKPGIGYDPGDTITFEGIEDGEEIGGGDGGDVINIPIITTPSGCIAGVNFPPNILREFNTPPVLIVNSENGVGAELIPVMRSKGLTKTDVGSEQRKTLIGIVSVVDCIGDNKEVVGYVNGVEYSGPYHVMSNGLKMTGATHSETDSIIYDTIEESLGQPVVSSSTTTATESPEVVTEPTTEEPIIVTEPTTTTTPTMDTSTTNTNTSTSSETDSGDSTPPSTPSSGGGYGGY